MYIIGDGSGGSGDKGEPVSGGSTKLDSSTIM